jgi:hypothetical protein
MSFGRRAPKKKRFSGYVSGNEFDSLSFEQSSQDELSQAEPQSLIPTKEEPSVEHSFYQSQFGFWSNVDMHVNFSHRSYDHINTLPNIEADRDDGITTNPTDSDMRFNDVMQEMYGTHDDHYGEFYLPQLPQVKIEPELEIKIEDIENNVEMTETKIDTLETETWQTITFDEEGNATVSEPRVVYKI